MYAHVNGTKIYEAKQTLLYLHDSIYDYHTYTPHTLRIQIEKYYILFLTNNKHIDIKILR